MNRKYRNIVVLPKVLLRFGFVCLAVSLVAGCRSGGVTSAYWKEDRGIPFSPDDRAIAYRHRDAVYVARTQGDKHRRIFTAEPGSILSTPHWAPGQRAVLFAATDGKRHAENGLLTYELWYWPAPEDIWTSNLEASREDTAKLPTDWSPASSRRLASARCRAKIQVKADALFSWHPDGNRVLFLDTDDSGLQTVMSLDVDNGTRTVASPIRAASLAFSISPNGKYLVGATRDAEASALWFGPIGADRIRWETIEESPGPRIVPEQHVKDGRSSLLYDMRPRLAIWSPDSRWLAHLRVLPETKSTKSNAELGLVLTRVATSEPRRVIAMPHGQTGDLHWAPYGEKLGLLSNNRLLLVDSESGAVTELSGTLEVERFMGWSKPGTHLAYLTPAEDFDATTALVPIGRVRWAPASRHNLMVAQPNGTLPESRFGLMNISFARWSNKSTKLSFWATHLPTVSNLPPGDPAAVLDLDEDAIRWYPTDVTEYSQVGHYYLLNRQYEEAAKFYGNALKHVTERDKNRVLVARIRLWRGLSRLASGDSIKASEDLSFFREHILPSDFRIPEPGWDEVVFRNLSADRIFLSTMLSMGQIRLAIDESVRIVEQDEDARQIQALCYLAMIDRAIGQHELFTDGVLTQLVPRAMQSKQVPREVADRLVATYLEAALHPDNQRYLSDRTKRRLAETLVELAESMRGTHLQDAIRLSESAAILYRESGESALEIGLLKTTAEM